ncbi:hypothetical protein C3B44_08025 [Corynebacterium yudongzhengii]|uniref:Uncharacterized protein n=1 Tax=Corynebacterium yudongzhengii TaxID=2080740 RepID=A0A2U1T7U7_9CORY|nr:hypothetical protein [Corynebacterium yudongzhengii]AWB82305.1 hypothetical protein C3B44_08025 [Corynebacterium yudongzhengii]PWC02076.1 hypothetical protein DF222_04355 [Corynebacterium yudongzhengii]
MASPRKLRRVVRRSAVDYDRSADTPGSWADREPSVLNFLDGEEVADDTHDTEEGAVDRLLDERPPHYGGD